MTNGKGKKGFIILTAILIVLFVMQFIKKSYFPNNPDIGKIVLDSIYKVPSTKNKLGELRNFTVTFDSTLNDDIYFKISIQGVKEKASYKGQVTKHLDNWEIKKLVNQ